MQRIGGVGMAARASGHRRDIRASHPYAAYSFSIEHQPILKHHGDVMSRLMIRCKEVLQSVDYILHLLAEYTPTQLPSPDYEAPLAARSLAFSLVEGWRGEICHAAITDAEGEIECYKIKDPSLHNWLALAIAVRGEGISDFPICNKSFNLSYCGYDL
jgi:Ni,Fe-hydrogenase III large subunit